MGEIERFRPEYDLAPEFTSDPVPRPTVWKSHEVDQTGRVIEVHHHYRAPDPAPVRKETVADRFAPHFVLMMYGVVIFGLIGGICMILIPPFMAAVVALTASLITIVIAAVGFLFAVIVFAFLARFLIKDWRADREDDHCE
jgi:hypothetical protein